MESFTTVSRLFWVPLILPLPSLGSHPNDEDAHFRLSEEQIFTAIFAYVDHLFGKIKPKKLFFMAVDGVAPRAKMNQQRSRRFRTAKEAREVREKALRNGEQLPEEKAFDSNCITPGEHAAHIHLTKSHRSYDPDRNAVHGEAVRAAEVLCKQEDLGRRQLARHSGRPFWTRGSRRRRAQDYRVYPAIEGPTQLRSKHPSLLLRIGRGSHDAGLAQP